MVEVRIIYCRPCGFQDRAVKLANDVLNKLGAVVTNTGTRVRS